MFYLELFNDDLFMNRQGVQPPLRHAIAKANEQLVQHKASRARLRLMDTEEVVWDSKEAGSRTESGTPGYVDS